jgi:uncharacterized protein with beta-barrel porin domain
MSWNKKMMLLAGVAALGFTTSSLRAADVAGSFTLPSETNWGVAALPAGDYTFTLDQATINGRITVYQGTKAVMMVQSQGISQTNTSGESSMKIVNGRVRYLRLAPAGLTYSYAPHKKEAQLMAGHPTQFDKTVLVATR